MQIVTSQHLQALLSAVPGTPRVVASGNFGTPFGLLGLLDSAIESYTLNLLNGHGPLPDREGVTLETSFVGASMRRSPRLRYIPARLSTLPSLFNGPLPVDIVIVHTSTPRDHTVSLGIEVNVLPAAIEACRARGGIVIAQMNPNMPYTFGDAQLPLDVIDYAVEIEEELPLAPVSRPDETSRAIGARVAEMIPDGATLQLGIGEVPDATLSGLTHRGGLRVWSEMGSDGLLALERQGCMDAESLITVSFWFGSHELYDWLDGNPRVRMQRTEKTNDPALISAQRFMTSVNTALQIDLLGQANASRINRRIYSGFGGQTDFIVGAVHAPGGQAIMALRSWHAKADVSTIVPVLTEPTTSFQASAVVTERGVAPLIGYSQEEQAAALIDHAAHPDARDGLRHAAQEMGLL